MTTTADPQKLLARLIDQAADREIDDASFRRRMLRASRQLQNLLGNGHEQAEAAPAGKPAARGRAPAAPAARPSPYRYIAVPNGSGGTTSVSLSIEAFEELAEVMGGPAKVAEHARKVAVGHKPDSGISRSAYVLRRLQQRAARAAR